MGTPGFAVASLDILVKNNYNVVGVITAPDRPAGRGQKISMSDVKKYAIDNDLKVLQPEKFKNKEFLEELSALKANLQVVVAFRMLPEIVWDMPEYGTFNLHASLLPQYRGAAPINWAVINGEKETGVTTFVIEKEIDTGNIIFQEKVKISDTQTAGELHDNLMQVGAKLVLKTVDQIHRGEVQSINQKELFENKNDLKPAPKIFKEDCEIDWNNKIDSIYNKIRGLSPYPCAWTKIQKGEKSMTLKIFDATLIEDSTSGELKIESDNKTYVNISTPNGVIGLNIIQLSGKKKMDIKSFLAGNDISLFKINA